ncbi:MAG: hypothetical protein KQA31_02325 [Candidatus Aenigmarchaeota archaeon]|nr:hypothetical protein [Candidatus Aenigmarchaeota archaeon]
MKVKYIAEVFVIFVLLLNMKIVISVDECIYGSDCNGKINCEWPKTTYCENSCDGISGNNYCSCRFWGDQPKNCNPCLGKSENICIPTQCPSKYIDCGISGDGKSKAGCFVYSSCSDKCDSCGNAYKVKRYCKTTTTQTTTPSTTTTQTTTPSTIQCSINITANCTRCEHFCTYTPGGWMSTCSGNNVGCLRDKNWGKVIGEKLIVGDPNVIPGYTITFTSSKAVDNFKTGQGTPNILDKSYINPITTSSGQFGVALTALKLNVLFSDAGVITPGLGDLEISSGKFKGMKVREFLNLAEKVLSGNKSFLPENVTISYMNNVASYINENFDNCVSDKGFLDSCTYQINGTLKWIEPINEVIINLKNETNFIILVEKYNSPSVFSINIKNNAKNYVLDAYGININNNYVCNTTEYVSCSKNTQKISNTQRFPTSNLIKIPLPFGKYLTINLPV